MKGIYDELRGLGAEVLAISFAPPEKVAVYVEKYPQPFPVLSDPERATYKEFSLEKTSWGQIFQPRVVGRFLKLMFKGWMPTKSGKNDDLLQLGGDFVLDEQRRLVYAYRSADPTDRPSVEELLAEVRKSAGAD